MIKKPIHDFTNHFILPKTKCKKECMAYHKNGRIWSYDVKCKHLRGTMGHDGESIHYCDKIKGIKNILGEYFGWPTSTTIDNTIINFPQKHVVPVVVEVGE